MQVLENIHSPLALATTNPINRWFPSEYLTIPELSSANLEQGTVMNNI